jgi:hypothetical protein
VCIDGQTKCFNGGSAGTLTCLQRDRAPRNHAETVAHHVRFEVFTAVTLKNDVFWVVRPCGSCKNRRFGGTWRLLHQGDKNR